MELTGMRGTVAVTRDIHSISGTLLVPRGGRVNAAVLQSVSGSSCRSRITVRVRETFVYNDIYLQSRISPYREICDRLGERNVLRLAGDIALPSVILEEYHFMRIKDEYTYRHCVNTALLTLCLAMGFFDDRRSVVRATSCSFTHDLGKSRVPSGILHSSRPLTEREFAIVKEHPAYGAVLCSHYFGDAHAPNTAAALRHHEKKDGSGYPLGIGLRDHTVSFIIVADIFDALISKRPYRSEPYDVRGAIDVLCRSVEKGELERDHLAMLIALHRSSPVERGPFRYSLNARGVSPRINQYDVRRAARRA